MPSQERNLANESLSWSLGLPVASAQDGQVEQEVRVAKFPNLPLQSWTSVHVSNFQSLARAKGHAPVSPGQSGWLQGMGVGCPGQKRARTLGVRRTEFGSHLALSDVGSWTSHLIPGVSVFLSVDPNGLSHRVVVRLEITLPGILPQGTSHRHMVGGQQLSGLLIFSLFSGRVFQKWLLGLLYSSKPTLLV